MSRVDVIPNYSVTDLHMDLSSAGHGLFGADVIHGYDPKTPLTLKANNGDVMQYVPNVDFPRLLIANYQIATVNVCPYPYSPELNDLTSPKPQMFMREYRKHESVAEEVVNTYPHLVEFAQTRDGLAATLGAGKMAFIKAIEGLHLSQNSKTGFRQLEKLLDSGLSVVGWMWNEPTSLGTSCTQEADDKGISDYGKDVLQYLDKPGMIIDISHSSAKTAHDILNLTSQAKVIATHAAARALVNHPRNLPDEIAKAVALHGLPLVKRFIAIDPDQGASADDFAAHAAYLRDLNGDSSKIALGPDFGGTALRSRIDGLDNVATFKEAIHLALLKKDFSINEIANIIGENGRNFYLSSLPVQI